MKLSVNHTKYLADLANCIGLKELMRK